MKKIYTAQDLADLWNVSRTMIYKLAKNNEIQPISIGSSLRFKPEQILEYEANHETIAFSDNYTCNEDYTISQKVDKENTYQFSNADNYKLQNQIMKFSKVIGG